MRCTSKMAQFRKDRKTVWMIVAVLLANALFPSAAAALSFVHPQAKQFFVAVICSPDGLKQLLPNGQLVPIKSDAPPAPTKPVAAQCLACLTASGPMAFNIPQADIDLNRNPVIASSIFFIASKVFHPETGRARHCVRAPPV